MELVKKLKVQNALGLHARAATCIVRLVDQHRSRLTLKKGDAEADGENILSIIALSCGRGTEVEARVVGEDCEALMKALSRLFEDKFGEQS